MQATRHSNSRSPNLLRISSEKDKLSRPDTFPGNGIYKLLIEFLKKKMNLSAFRFLGKGGYGIVLSVRNDNGRLRECFSDSTVPLSKRNLRKIPALPGSSNFALKIMIKRAHQTSESFVSSTSGEYELAESAARWGMGPQVYCRGSFKVANHNIFMILMQEMSMSLSDYLLKDLGGASSSCKLNVVARAFMTILNRNVVKRNIICFDLKKENFLVLLPPSPPDEGATNIACPRVYLGDYDTQFWRTGSGDVDIRVMFKTVLFNFITFLSNFIFLWPKNNDDMADIIPDPVAAVLTLLFYEAHADKVVKFLAGYHLYNIYGMYHYSYAYDDKKRNEAPEKLARAHYALFLEKTITVRSVLSHRLGDWENTHSMDDVRGDSLWLFLLAANRTLGLPLSPLFEEALGSYSNRQAFLSRL